MLNLSKISVSVLLLGATVGLTACQQNETQSSANRTLSGQYVSEGYAQRAKGNDWVMVTVAEDSANSLSVKVTSREDIKKPTCSFSGEAVKTAENRYEVKDDGSVLVFSFTPDSVSISSTDPVALHYHCSGGASLADTYKKL